MRSVLCLLVLLVFAQFPAKDVHAQVGTMYRGLVWGVTMDEVRAHEKAMFYEQVENSLVFLEEKNGRRSLIRYDFNKDALWRIHFEYVGLHYPTPQQVLDVVMDEQARMTRRFGKPVREELVWRNSRYRNHPKFFTRAYGSGHVRIETGWERGGTVAALESFRDDDGYHLSYTLENVAARTEMDRDRTYRFYESLN